MITAIINSNVQTFYFGRNTCIPYVTRGSGPQFLLSAFHNVATLKLNTSSQQTQQRLVAIPISTQITTARHAIQTVCGVGVAVGSNTRCGTLVMVGDPASKNGQTVS